jgi:hypothetical protein
MLSQTNHKRSRSKTSLVGKSPEKKKQRASDSDYDSHSDEDDAQEAKNKRDLKINMSDQKRNIKDQKKNNSDLKMNTDASDLHSIEIFVKNLPVNKKLQHRSLLQLTKSKDDVKLVEDAILSALSLKMSDIPLTDLVTFQLGVANFMRLTYFLAGKYTTPEEFLDKEADYLDEEIQEAKALQSLVQRTECCESDPIDVSTVEVVAQPRETGDGEPDNTQETHDIVNEAFFDGHSVDKKMITSCKLQHNSVHVDDLNHATVIKLLKAKGAHYKDNCKYNITQLRGMLKRHLRANHRLHLHLHELSKLQLSEICNCIDPQFKHRDSDRMKAKVAKYCFNMYPHAPLLQGLQSLLKEKISDTLVQRTENCESAAPMDSSTQPNIDTPGSTKGC